MVLDLWKKELLDNNDLDDYLKQGWYGDMVYALLNYYKLSNAYLTNIIKCGMNNKGSFENEEEAYKMKSIWELNCTKNNAKNLYDKYSC